MTVADVVWNYLGETDPAKVEEWFQKLQTIARAGGPLDIAIVHADGVARTHGVAMVTGYDQSPTAPL